MNVARRIAARFVLVYLVLYYLPFPGAYIPWTEWVDEAYYDAAYGFGGWVAQHLLGAPAELVDYGGSGDKWVDWGLFIGLAVIAALVTATWTAVDGLRDRPRVTRAMWWYVRWTLAAIAISYGIVKVLPTQFTFPAPARMTENVGDMSPHGLLWTFMGASTAYVIFTGVVELVGGMLLLWRRTRLLGALVVAGAMTNVVMLNLCYDVTVKLMSMHLLLTAIVLAAPDARRLAAMFVLSRAVEAPPPAPVFASERRRRLAIAAQILLFALLMWRQVGTQWDRFRASRRYPPYFASYTVREMRRDGALVAGDDPTRWSWLAAEKRGSFVIESGDSTQRHYDASWDAERRTITLTDWDDDARRFELTFDDDAGRARFAGTVDGHAVEVVGDRHEPWLLEQPRFHWVQELPFNR